MSALASFVSGLIPEAVKDAVNKVLDAAGNLLKGEPALVIGNGAAVVIYLVAKAVGSIPDQSFAEAAGQATAAIVILNSVLVSIRQFVTPVNKPA